MFDEEKELGDYIDECYDRMRDERDLKAWEELDDSKNL